MNKKGFTLIELLAVIVILAIIALIATPIVLNIIKDSRESAGLRSAEMYLKGVETSVASAIIHEKNVMDGEHPIMPEGDVCLGALQVSNETTTCNGEVLEVETNGEIPTSGSITIIGGKITNVSFTYSNGKTIVKNDGKLVYVGSESGEQKVKITPKKETYTVGDEVKIGEEGFYVIADDTEKVTLLAKYNLNKEGTEQLNATYSETAVAFSSTNYWSSETEYPLNLNDYPIPEGVTSVITTAKTYGISLGGTGRLLSWDEGETLRVNNEGLILGTSYDCVDGGLLYWIDQACDYNYANYMYFSANYVYPPDFYRSDYYGIRPVVEISKSDIS